MTKADINLAHKTASELAMYAKYIDQLGHAKLAACVRNASSLLQKMVEEAEAKDLELMRIVQGAANRAAEEKHDG